MTIASAICLDFSIGISRVERTLALAFSPLADSLMLELFEVALEEPSRLNDANLVEGSEQSFVPFSVVRGEHKFTVPHFLIFLFETFFLFPTFRFTHKTSTTI